jgi:HD-GYP domain-containing protein (c-di-GMP phosphodiesterase class II)
MASKKTVELEQRNKQLKRLVELSVTLNSTLDLDALLQLITATATELLDCQAASILLCDEKYPRLYFAAATGSDPKTLAEVPVPIEGSLAGLIFRTNRSIIMNNVEQDPRHYSLVSDHIHFHVQSLLGVPMLIKDRIIGVLEALNKRNGEFTTGDESIALVTASHAAIAIDNATLFDGLQHSNLELTLAYDATIEGWSHALDLRDEETQGHTERVTAMTLRLVRLFNLGDEAVVQVRRGALLHDIGKMGIPDHILFKTSPLTDEEWVIMRKHSQFAFDMLSPIRYLQPALDIPYCHHEKWDGTGYPRGLKGDQIPLAARIFAIVDIWDALASDRPYRAAWPQERIIEHLQALSGTHFDPQIVEVVLESGLLWSKPQS